MLVKQVDISVLFVPVVSGQAVSIYLVPRDEIILRWDKKEVNPLRRIMNIKAFSLLAEIIQRTVSLV